MAVSERNGVLISDTVRDALIKAATGHSATAAANNDVAITLAAGGASVSNILAGLSWSYSEAPTGGGLTVKIGSDTYFQIDITAAGPGFIPFAKPKRFPANTAVTITLEAGGGTCVGKLNVDALSENQGPAGS